MLKAVDYHICLYAKGLYSKTEMFQDLQSILSHFPDSRVYAWHKSGICSYVFQLYLERVVHFTGSDAFVREIVNFTESRRLNDDPLLHSSITAVTLAAIATAPVELSLPPDRTILPVAAREDNEVRYAVSDNYLRIR